MIMYIYTLYFANSLHMITFYVRPTGSPYGFPLFLGERKRRFSWRPRTLNRFPTDLGLTAAKVTRASFRQCGIATIYKSLHEETNANNEVLNFRVCEIRMRTFIKISKS